MNYIGLICAVTTFFNVWLGHAAVRSIEARAISIKPPTILFALSGLILVIGAIFNSSLPISAVLGITGVILIWDSFEFSRQQRRVAKGHAPANPNNPRHRRILAEYPMATSINWLKREPLGRQVSIDEQNSMRKADR